MSATSGTGCLQLGQFVNRMREVGIHLNDVLVAVIKRPLEASDVGSAQSLLARSLEDVDAVGAFGNHRVHDGACAIRRIVIDNEHIKLVLGQVEHGVDDGSDILLLVISRNDYYTV